MLYRDAEYLELVRDLAPYTMNATQGKGAIVSGVLRPEPDSVWISAAPHNQLAYRYALRVPLFKPALTAHDIVLLLRRAESVRTHDRARFDALPNAGEFHGAPLLDASDLVDDPTLDMTIDAFRSILISASGGPAPLPAEDEPRLAGFSWFASERIRVYVATPAGEVIGIDVDSATSADSLQRLTRHCADLPARHMARATEDPFAHAVLFA